MEKISITWPPPRIACQLPLFGARRVACLYITIESVNRSPKFPQCPESSETWQCFCFKDNSSLMMFLDPCQSLQSHTITIHVMANISLHISTIFVEITNTSNLEINQKAPNTLFHGYFAVVYVWGPQHIPIRRPWILAVAFHFWREFSYQLLAEDIITSEKTYTVL